VGDIRNKLAKSEQAVREKAEADAWLRSAGYVHPEYEKSLQACCAVCGAEQPWVLDSGCWRPSPFFCDPHLPEWTPCDLEKGVWKVRAGMGTTELKP